MKGEDCPSPLCIHTCGIKQQAIVGVIGLWKSIKHLLSKIVGISPAILLREPAKKLVHIDEDATADFDYRPVQTIGLAVKEQPPQATLRKGRVLLAELLDGQQFPLGVL